MWQIEQLELPKWIITWSEFDGQKHVKTLAEYVHNNLRSLAV